MRVFRTISTTLILIGFGLMSGLSAGPFEVPAEGPVPFRRDRIPLDVNDIRELSEHLSEMADHQHGETPDNRRAAAQMLALSLALNPGNTAARELLQEFQEGEHDAPGKSRGLGVIRDRLAKHLAWLSDPNVGSDANALAACMSDVLGGGKGDGSEQGKWRGWVPEVAAYKEDVKLPNQNPFDSGEPSDSKPPGTPNNDPDPGKPFTLTVTESRIITPIWHSQGGASWVLKPGVLSMSARQGDKNEPFQLVLGNQSFSDRWNQYANWIEGVLATQQGKLPGGLQVSVGGDEFIQSLASNKTQAISAPVALLANAAITGRKTTGIVIGKIDKGGEFGVPKQFWLKLQAFGKGNGERMVVPKDAQEYMDAILAMEKPEFFMEYEIRCASSFKQLALLTQEELDGDLALASDKFKEITGKFAELQTKGSSGMSLGNYVSNKFVKQRLMEVLQLDPNHISAKMLLMQGSGKRPTRISHEILAEEMLRILEPVAEIQSIPYWQLEEGTAKRPDAGAIYELCHDPLKALERYVERDDKDLLKQGEDVLDRVRDMDRALDSRGPFHEVIGEISRTSGSVAIGYRGLVNQLLVESGERKAP